MKTAKDIIDLKEEEGMLKMQGYKGEILGEGSKEKKQEREYAYLWIRNFIRLNFSADMDDQLLQELTLLLRRITHYVSFVSNYSNCGYLVVAVFVEVKLLA